MNAKAEVLKQDVRGRGHGLNGYKGPMWDAWQAQSLEWLAGRKVIPAADVSRPK